MPPFRFFSSAGFSALAILLGLAGCGSPANNSALFQPSGPGPATAGAGSSSESGGSAGANSSAGGSGGTSTLSGGAGAMTSGGNGTGGSSGESSNAGAQNGGADSGGSAGAGGMSSGGNGGTGGSLGDCSRFNSNATYYSGTQHCYLAMHSLATFADASSNCSTVGAHLVTLSDQAENDFVWSLDTNEHWIGATDGKDPKDPGPGTYAWVDGEPFTYIHWSMGEPNATPTPCPEGNNGGGECYEHCAFQWSGGVLPGEWNDRLCASTVESVCEWDD
jgi:hypothetical protein